LELASDCLITKNVWAYGVGKYFKINLLGHFMNDLCSACWFNYLLVYLKTINPIDPLNPGLYAG
jgi:hypothetical protein